MIETPGSVVTITANGFVTGLVGSIGLTLLNSDDSVAIARTTAGITEPTSGTYSASLTVPLVLGDYLIFWDDAGTGALATEDLIVSYGSALPSGSVYLTLDQLKASLTMTNTSFADADANLAIRAASRAVDSTTGRRFWLDVGATNVRYYTPNSCRGVLEIDDLVTLGSVTIDRAGTGSFTETWVLGTDFVLEPFNAPAEQPARPYESIRPRRMSGQYWPEFVEQSVKVTGQFGWASIPDDVTEAAGILAAKLLKRTREAPFGIVAAGIDGVAMHIARTDPDVYMLLKNYNRTVIVV